MGSDLFRGALTALLLFLFSFQAHAQRGGRGSPPKPAASPEAIRAVGTMSSESPRKHSWRQQGTPNCLMVKDWVNSDSNWLAHPAAIGDGNAKECRQQAENSFTFFSASGFQTELADRGIRSEYQHVGKMCEDTKGALTRYYYASNRFRDGINATQAQIAALDAMIPGQQESRSCETRREELALYDSMRTCKQLEACADDASKEEFTAYAANVVKGLQEVKDNKAVGETPFCKIVYNRALGSRPLDQRFTYNFLDNHRQRPQLLAFLRSQEVIKVFGNHSQEAIQAMDSEDKDQWAKLSTKFENFCRYSAINSKMNEEAYPFIYGKIFENIINDRKDLEPIARAELAIEKQFAENRYQLTKMQDEFIVAGRCVLIGNHEHFIPGRTGTWSAAECGKDKLNAAIAKTPPSEALFSGTLGPAFKAQQCLIQNSSDLKEQSDGMIVTSANLGLMLGTFGLGTAVNTSFGLRILAFNRGGKAIKLAGPISKLQKTAAAVDIGAAGVWAGISVGHIAEACQLQAADMKLAVEEEAKPEKEMCVSLKYKAGNAINAFDACVGKSLLQMATLPLNAYGAAGAVRVLAKGVTEAKLGATAAGAAVGNQAKAAGSSDEVVSAATAGKTANSADDVAASGWKEKYNFQSKEPETFDAYKGLVIDRKTALKMTPDELRAAGKELGAIQRQRYDKEWERLSATDVKLKEEYARTLKRLEYSMKGKIKPNPTSLNNVKDAAARTMDENLEATAQKAYQQLTDEQEWTTYMQQLVRDALVDARKMKPKGELNLTDVHLMRVLAQRARVNNQQPISTLRSGTDTDVFFGHVGNGSFIDFAFHGTNHGSLAHAMQMDFVRKTLEAEFKGGATAFWNTVSRSIAGRRVWDELFDAGDRVLNPTRPEFLNPLVIKDIFPQVFRAEAGIGTKVIASPIPRKPAVTRDQLKQASELTNRQRMVEAEIKLKRELTQKERLAVIEAHKVGTVEGRGFKGLSDKPYTRANLNEKTLILRNAGFSELEAAKLQHLGITGSVAPNSPVMPVLQQIRSVAMGKPLAGSQLPKLDPKTLNNYENRDLGIALARTGNAKEAKKYITQFNASKRDSYEEGFNDMIEASAIMNPNMQKGADAIRVVPVPTKTHEINEYVWRIDMGLGHMLPAGSPSNMAASAKANLGKWVQEVWAKANNGALLRPENREKIERWARHTGASLKTGDRP